MTDTNPAVERYLYSFAAALASVPEAARNEMVGEIRSHIGEALHAGRDLAETLEKLGPAERLAAAYRAELLLNPAQSGAVGQRFRLMGALAGVSLLSLAIITLLGTLALSFILSGAAVFVAGVGLPLVPESAISTPFTIGQTRVIMMLIGAGCLTIGVVAGAGLQAYLRVAGRAVQDLRTRLRPQASGTPA